MFYRRKKPILVTNVVLVEMMNGSPSVTSNMVRATRDSKATLFVGSNQNVGFCPQKFCDSKFSSRDTQITFEHTRWMLMQVLIRILSTIEMVIVRSGISPFYSHFSLKIDSFLERAGIFPVQKMRWQWCRWRCPIILALCSEQELTYLLICQFMSNVLRELQINLVWSNYYNITLF